MVIQDAKNMHMVQRMPLPPDHFLLHYNPKWFTFLVPAGHVLEHTHTFNCPLSGTTRVSRYQKGKIWILQKQETEWQWHRLCCIQVCMLLQTDNHASTPPLSFVTGQMPFLPPNQQHQSTEGCTGRRPLNRILCVSIQQ